MLQYMAMGTQDPQRETIYNQLLCKGYELADKTYFLKDWEKAYGYFADKFRKYVLTPGGIDDAMDMYKNFRGKEPGTDPLLKNRGLK